ncbi:MAG: hypothetical protein ACKOGP_01475 [Bacteroidota bacterium]
MYNSATLKISLILLTIMVSMQPLIVKAQKIETSADALDDFSLGYTQIIGFTESGFFILTSNNGYDVSGERVGFKSPKYKLGFAGNDLKLLWEKPIEPKVENGIIRMISQADDKIVLLSSSWNKSKSTLTINSYYIDEKGNSNGDGTTMSNIEFQKEPYFFGSSSSLHKEAFAIYAAAEVESGVQISVVVFDNEQRVLSQNNELIRQPSRNFSVEDFAVSDSGDISFLGLRSEKVKALSAKREISWFAYLFRNDELLEKAIGRGLEMPHAHLAIDEFRNEAVFTGFYSDKQSYIGAGILYGRMGLSEDTAIQIKNVTIDASQNLRLKGARNNGESGGLAGFPIRKIIPRGDGGVAIIAESAYTTEYSYFDSFSQTYTRRLEYNFGDIVVFTLNNGGSLQWSASVSKEQSSMDDGGIFSSYCMLVGSHKLDFLFSEPISRKAKVLRGTVSHQGVPEKVIPIQLPEGTLLLSEGGKQVSENSVIIPALIKRKLHLIRFSNP